MDKKEIEFEQTSFRLDKALLKALRKAVADREIKLQQAADEALRAWIKAQEDSTTSDPSRPLIKRDNIHDQTAKLVADWTEKELADAQAIIEMLRANDELSTLSIATLIDRWRLKHGHTGSSTIHKRKRA